jgi:hypothetical protein
MREDRMKREKFSERLELLLPPEWDQKLSAQAARAVTTKSELARQAIIARLRELEPMPQLMTNLLLSTQSAAG